MEVHILQASRASIRGVAALAVALFATGLLAGGHTASAKVTGTTTYDVQGCQLSEVWDDIQEKGPPDGGVVYAGEAVSDLGVSITPDTECSEVPNSECQPDGVAHSCKATLTVAYALETTIKLPKWTNQADSCDEARTEWARFLAKLTEHENGHDTAVQKALDAAKPKAMFMSAAFVNCDKATARKQAEAAEAALMKDLDTELDRLNGVMNKANTDYDTETKHGETQGAKLDTTIRCEKEKTPKQQLEEIVSGLDLLDPESLRTALQNKLNSAIKQIDKGNTTAAKAQIDAFVRLVKNKLRTKKIDKEVAEQLIEQAQAARDAL